GRRDGLWSRQRRAHVVDPCVACHRGPEAAVTLDLTERKEAEAALAASDVRFREFLADIHLGALMLDASGKVVFINDHLLHLLGRTRAEMLGQDWIEQAVPKRERAALRA